LAGNNGQKIPKIAPFHGGSRPHLTHGYMGPPEPIRQTAFRSTEPFLQGTPMLWTDRHTNHTTKHVAICRIYAMHMMWPKKSMIDYYSHMRKHSLCAVCSPCHWGRGICE